MPECSERAPGGLRRYRERSVQPPEPAARLKGAAASIEVKGAHLEQWQYEVTGASGVLYAPDSEARVVWIVLASVRHPKDTE